MKDPGCQQEEQRKLDVAFVGGLAWTAGAKWISQLVSWPAVLISARLLSPSDFGLVDMAGFYFVITNVLAEFGVGTSVLQLRELERSTIAQLNTLSLAFGIVAWGCSAAVAPLIAGFFHAPLLNRLVVITSVTFIITALQAVPLGLMQRAMEYRQLSVIEAVQSLIQAVVTVSCALAGYGYWSLIAGTLAGRGAGTIQAVCRYPVALAWPRWNDVAKPLRFGVAIALSRLAWAINMQSDGVVIGRTMGQSQLGSYRLAMSLASAPAEKVGTLIMRVTGPLFAKIQDDRDLTRRYLLVISEVLALVIFPLVFGLAVVAPEAVYVLLGPKWQAAVLPLQWLAVFMAVRTLSSLVSQVLVSLRFARFSLIVAIINFLAMPPAFYFASRWGLGAVASMWFILSPVTILPAVIKVFRATHCTLWQYVKVLWPPLISSTAMVGAVLALRMWSLGHQWSPYLRVSLEVAAGGVVYGAVLFGFFRDQVMRYVHFFLQLRKSPDVPLASP